MSIDLRTITGKLVDTAGGPVAPRKTEAKKTSHQPPSSDSLALTDTVTRLKQAEQALGSGSVIDTALVARVAEALQAGTYEIDAERIAEKIIELESQFPNLEDKDG